MRDFPIDPRTFQALSRYSYIGIFFGVAPVVGWLGGHWLDGRFATSPWLGAVGVLLGIVAAFRELIRLSMRAMREKPTPPSSDA